MNLLLVFVKSVNSGKKNLPGILTPYVDAFSFRVAG